MKLTPEQRYEDGVIYRAGYTAFVLDQGRVVPAWGEEVIEQVLDRLDRVNRRYVRRISHQRRYRELEGA